MPLSLLLCRPGSRDLFGGLVARMEGASGDVCHVAISDGDWLIEAVGAGVHAVPLDRWRLTNGGQAVPLHLTDAQAAGMWSWLRSKVWPPTPYAWGQIAGDVLTLATHHPFVAPGHGCVCSELAAMALAIVGVTPWAPEPPSCITPQQIADWSLAQDAKPVGTGPKATAP